MKKSTKSILVVLFLIIAGIGIRCHFVLLNMRTVENREFVVHAVQMIRVNGEGQNQQPSQSATPTPTPQRGLLHVTQKVDMEDLDKIKAILDLLGKKNN